MAWRVVQQQEMVISPSKSPEDVAGRAGGLLMRLGLAVLMIALPIAAIYSRRLLFTLMPVGAGLIFLGATLVPGNTVMADLRRALASPVAFAAVVGLLWAAASILWTPFRAPAIEQFAKSAGTIALVLVVIAALPSRSRTSDINLLPIGSGIAAIVAAALVLVLPAAMPATPDLESSNLERAAAGLVLLVWPALSALGIRERWASGGALAVAVTVAAVAIWTPAALAGMAAGALVFSLSTSKPRRFSLVLAILFALLILIAPTIPLVLEKLFAAFPGMPLSVTKTVAAWAELVREAPGRLLTGYGYTTMSRALATGFLPAAAPASVLFELWFELGIIGAAAAASVVALAFIAAGRIEANAAPFVLAGITCALVISIWGLATLQLWWINLLGAMAISFGCVLKGQTREQRPSAGIIRDGRPEP